jgi:hypothetical protein
MCLHPSVGAAEHLIWRKEDPSSWWFSLLFAWERAEGKSLLMMVFIVAGMTMSFLSLSCVVFCSSRCCLRYSLISVSFLCFFLQWIYRFIRKVAIQGRYDVVKHNASRF